MQLKGAVTQFGNWSIRTHYWLDHTLTNIFSTRIAWEGLGDMAKEKAMEEFCSLVEKIAPELEAYLEAQCREIEEKRRKKLEEERRKREEEERRRKEEEERLEQERLLKIEEQRRQEEAEQEERFGQRFTDKNASVMHSINALRLRFDQ